MTFEEYLNRYHTKQTVACYTYLVDIFLIRYPHAFKLTYDEITQYIKEKGASKNMTTQLAAIKKYFDYLIEIGVRDDHPCKNIRLHKKQRPIQIQDLFSPEELELLLQRENRYSNLSYRNKVIISLLIYQGLTSSELCRLNCEDIDLDRGTIYVKGSSRNSARTLDLMPNQILMIQNYITQNRRKLASVGSRQFLITIRGVGESTEGINSIIEPLRLLYPERNLNPSTIRQSVIANKLNISKLPLQDVQLFAGHKWPSTTEQYKRKNNSELIEKINLWHPLR